MSDKILTNWTPDQLPDLTGKTYLITGGNSGIGFEAAKMLAAAGGDIVIACRNAEKAQQAVAEINETQFSDADAISLDLSSMESVHKAAAEFRSRHDRLDALINNAGIMQTPETRTVDGFELQLATNHLGHFLLASLLYDLVEKVSGRIVTVSSIGHKFGQMHLEDLMLTKGYSPTRAYTQSKLANLLFAQELDRRLRAADSTVKSVACHPGYSATRLQDTGPTNALNFVYKILNPLMAQPAYNGAIPTVLAAAGNEAEPGGYYGPRLLGEARGPVGDAKIAKVARDESTARRLWEKSELLVGQKWSFGDEHHTELRASA